MTTQKNHPAAGQPDSFDRYPGYYGSDLELTYTPQRSVFTLWAPTADKVRLNLYASGEGGEPEERLEMRPSDDGTWRVAAERDLKGTFYTFQIEKEGKWLDETPGIWAKAVGVNGDRAAVIDLRETDPEGWEADRAPELKMYSDIILYELHHRDFSVAPDSGIENKGKFLALTETGTKTPQGEASGLDHLKELGVTHIHILPSFDYATVDEARLNDKTYNWGYDPKNYNVPEGSYSTDPADPAARIREFKQMVQSLHRNGMRIVLDVVYNHTASVEHSNFNLTVPGYFYRHNADGSYSDASGCGNETASERAMVRHYIVESVKFWAKEYHIDGFRFDLMGIHDIETMNRIREELSKIDPTIFIYGEGWLAADSPLPPEKRAVRDHVGQMEGIAVFCDDFRDAVRGSTFDEHACGYASGNIGGHYEPVKFGIVGATQHPQVDYNGLLYSSVPYAAAPSQAVNFVASHDGYTVIDKLRALRHGQPCRRGAAPDRQTDTHHPAHGAGRSLHPRRRGDDAGQAGRTEQLPLARCRQPNRLGAESRTPRAVRLHPATDRPAQSASGVPHPDGRRAAAVAPVPRHGRFGRDRLYFGRTRQRRCVERDTGGLQRQSPSGRIPDSRSGADRGLPRRPDRSRQPRASLRRGRPHGPLLGAYRILRIISRKFILRGTNFVLH